MKKSVAISAAFLGMITSGGAMAASILDAASKTALETGFQQMQDTAADILITTWPFFWRFWRSCLLPSSSNVWLTKCSQNGGSGPRFFLKN